MKVTVKRKEVHPEAVIQCEKNSCGLSVNKPDLEEICRFLDGKQTINMELGMPKLVVSSMPGL